MVFLRISRLLALTKVILVTPSFALGQASPLQVDASSFVLPAPSSFHGGTSINPSGHTIGLNSRYLVRDGEPWLPVMGEFHFSRVPEAEWEQEVLKMKAAGVSIISTYVIWIHHEEIQGQFDWTGSRNLRAFVEICAKHGLYVYVRIGPWAHGEARNGGFPDWLLKATQNTRQNDPVYLFYVQPYYEQIAAQLRGLLWKDGGPVIGIQLENEYAKTGMGAGAEHILKLKQLAVQSGLDVPLYSVTGWDNAVVPKGEVVAVFGGYPDAPWGDSLTSLPPQEVYVFRFYSRVTGNMGAIGLRQGVRNQEKAYDFPFMTAEMGGGIQDTYHRRPVVSADDIAAMVPVMLGSGVNLYGSYMFQGGENPDGKLTTLQESQATGYPTDVPVKSYDFQAPLTEFGQETPVFRKLKVFDYFMQDFGPALASMEAFPPNVLPSSPTDTTVPRISVRANGSAGFLFFNNYVRQSTMPARPGFQVRVKLKDQSVSVPEQPVSLPSGVYGIWPINMKIGGSTLRYATAQPLARVENGKDSTIYFFETPGVRSEFVFDAPSNIEINGATGAKLTNSASEVVVSGMSTSILSAFSIKDVEGTRTEIVLLSDKQAERFWKISAGGKQRAVVTASDFYADDSTVTLQNVGTPNFTFQVMPGGQFSISGEGIHPRRANSAQVSELSLPVLNPKLGIQKVADAKVVPPVKLGPKLPWRATGVAVAPDDAAFDNAAKWNLTLSPDAWRARNLFLVIHYDGDVARLKSGGKLLVDDFFNGTPWTVGLNRFRQQIEKHGLQLEILPRRKDAPIYIENNADASDNKDLSQVVNLDGIDLAPEYDVSIRVSETQ